MRQLYKYSSIKILNKEELNSFDYQNYSIKQIEILSEDLYCVEILSKSSYIDILHY